MSYLSPQEEVAERYFVFVNDVVGMLAISLTGTALQFDKPAPVAAIFAVVLLLWAQSKGKDYARFAARHASRHRGVIGNLVLLWQIRFYLLGLLALWSVALGMLTTPVIYSIWPF